MKSNSQAVVENEELLTGVSHDTLTKVIYQIRNCERSAILVGLGDSEGVAALIREEHLKTTSVTLGQQLFAKP